MVVAVSCKVAPKPGDAAGAAGASAGAAGASNAAGGAGASGSAGSGGGSKPADGPCTSTSTLMPGQFATGAQDGWLVAQATASGDSASYTVQVELNVDPSFTHTPGTFDLGAAVEGNYASCRHCVVAFEGGTSPADAKRIYFQVKGTMTLESVTNPPTDLSKGAIEGVVLREAQIDPSTSQVTPAVGGRCLTITKASWDTQPPTSSSCQNADDCGDPSVMACDPTTKQCVKMQCESEGMIPCPDGKICLSQGNGSTFGACYTQCSPFDTPEGCPAGFDCQPLSDDLFSGKCVSTGQGAEGSGCTPTSTSTGCAPGLTCDGLPGETGVCRTRCEFWGDTPACPAGQQCVVGGRCSPDPGDPAPLGSPCAPTAEPLARCGSDGKALRGVCFAEPSGLVCRQSCRKGSSVFKDCPDGLVCTLDEGEGATPVCLPPPPP